MANQDKNTDSQPVNDQPVVDPGSPAALESANTDPNVQLQAEIDKPVGEGQNLYFFPDIQKSVVADSLEDAAKQVQDDIDALNKKDNK